MTGTDDDAAPSSATHRVVATAGHVDHGKSSLIVRLTVPDPSAFAARLRAGSPSVFSRIEHDHVLLDMRTVADEQVPDLARATWYALEGDDLDDED